MTPEERIAVLENTVSTLKEEVKERETEDKDIRVKLEEVRFKMKIIWGSLVAIFSTIGLAIVNFLME
jgi:accessory gene regulator protein AgrB